jgi:SET and MYND domain-containing protein
LQLSLKNPKVLDEYNELCYKDDDDDFKTEQGDARLKIMMQCHQLLLAMGVTPAVKLAHDLLDPDPILALRFISRLALNGFTICNSEQETLGVGVYPRASMINHSCRPNAVQTFFLSEGHVRRSHPPMLQITMCRDADIGEEITIGYCDVSPPLYDRRKALKNYNFLCDCKFCQDIKRGDALIGLRCTAVDIKCEGRVRSSPTDVPNSYEMIENRHYCCDSCGHSDFENSLKTISQLMTRIEAIESKLKDDSVNSNNKYTRRVGEELKQQFDSMLKYCNPQTSWFITRSSDVFINWCANALNYYPKGEEQLSLCHQALSVLNKSRMATKFCYDYEGSLAWLLKRGIEAKFRLFINPMDMEALSIMREVKRDLIRYYPSTDEIVLSLDESIRVYSNS